MVIEIMCQLTLSVAQILLGQNMYTPVQNVNQIPTMVVALFPNECPYELLWLIKKYAWVNCLNLIAILFFTQDLISLLNYYKQTQNFMIFKWKQILLNTNIKINQTQLVNQRFFKLLFQIIQLKMGNCQTCENIHQGSNANVLLIPEPSPFAELTADQLPDHCPQQVKSIYKKYGPFNFTTNYQYDWKEPQQNDQGVVYYGQWKDGKKCGRGKQIWRDGSIYEGYFEKDLANGCGRLIHSCGDVYEGDWVDDKAQGKGVYLHSDGSMYTGEWLNDKQHGYGQQKWIDGSEYEGNFENGLKQGNGVFMWADGSTYEGEFHLNKIQGYGKYVWGDEREYEGLWKNNKMHGKGIFTWPDGRMYQGEYNLDKKQGKGVFEWPDGRSYDGQWKNGKQDGQGFYKSKNGAIRQGIWKDGRKIKWLGNAIQGKQNT